MSEPKRWSELAGGATRDETELLRAGIAERMPSELRGQVWSAITLASAGGVAATGLSAVQNGAATAETAATAGVATKGLGLSLSTIVKGVIAVAVLGGAGVGIFHGQRSPALRASPSHVPATAGRTPSEVASAVVSEPARSEGSQVTGGSAAPTLASAGHARAKVAAAGSATADSSKSQPAPVASRPSPENTGDRADDSSPSADASSRLREESASVLAIRRALLAGNAREALSLVARARAAFPRGALAEEREALGVRALIGAGETEAGRREGEAFLRRFPRSPHAADVRRLLGSE